MFAVKTARKGASSCHVWDLGAHREHGWPAVASVYARTIVGTEGRIPATAKMHLKRGAAGLSLLSIAEEGPVRLWLETENAAIGSRSEVYPWRAVVRS